MTSLPRKAILTAATLAFALAAGCGDDEEEETTPLVLLPPTVAIEAITSSSGHRFEVAAADAPRFVEAGCDPGQTVSVALSFLDAARRSTFSLRPPGFCGGAPLCGTVVVTVEGPGGQSVSTRSAAEAPSLRLADLPFVPGEHVFRVELRDDSGNPVAVPGGDPEDSVTVEVRQPASCGAPDAGPDVTPDSGQPDAGSDASPDAGSDARDAASDSGLDARDAASESGDAAQG